MTETMQFAHRMSDSDALMRRIEKDPLRSTVTALWILDRSPDRSWLEDGLERATRLIPRLRQRVVSNPMSMAPPRWEIDPNFDLAFHVRRMKAPGRGTVRDLRRAADGDAGVRPVAPALGARDRRGARRRTFRAGIETRRRSGSMKGRP